MSKVGCFTLFAFLVAFHVDCRSLRPSLSDGVDAVQPHESYLQLIEQKVQPSSDGHYCKQMYGFLPCSSNILGHLFLILVYEYLLFHGESYLAAGGEQIFKILGPGVFGASAFDILGAVPESLILVGMLLLWFLFSQFQFFCSSFEASQTHQKTSLIFNEIAKIFSYLCSISIFVDSSRKLILC